MTTKSALPEHLQRRYKTWRSEVHAPRKADYQALVDFGQNPSEMIISCCDSRVHVTQIFNADTGEMFIHRNVAALVPPCESNTEHHGTSAAVEYAVRVLKVERLIVLGHSNCGGVAGCLDMCDGDAPDLLSEKSFIGRWVDILRPGYDRIPREAPRAERLAQLEKEAVRVSLTNLMSFPWLAEAVEADQLELIGLWIDIAEGRLEILSQENSSFVAI